MKKEVSGVITFKSTHHTIQAENFFKNKDIKFKVIPTPREITKSCGLAVIFDLEDIKLIEETIDSDGITIDSIYKYTKDGSLRKAEKIV